MQDTRTGLGTEYNDLNDRQRRFVERAARHAEDFATRAAEHDREASFPFENFAALHESGYARMCLPAEFNGEDADMEEFCLAQERLAQGCASTALSANMHGFATGLWTELWRQGNATFEMPMRMVGESGITVGGTVSEAESVNPFTEPAGRVERVEGGFRLNGRKVFGSNTPANPMLIFNGVLEEGGRRRILMFGVPKGTPGATVVEDWDTMGMRGTGSFTIEFKDCVVPEALKTMEWDAGASITDSPFSAGFVIWFGPSIGAVYTGIAVAARDAAKELVSKRSRIPHGPIKHTPAVQYGVADMYIGVEAARAMVRRSARRLKDPAWRDDAALALATATKHFAVETAKRVVDQALETVGGGAFFKRLPLERFYRDVRAGGFHPLSHYDALEVIGKTELGIPPTQEPRFV